MVFISAACFVYLQTCNLGEGRKSSVTNVKLCYCFIFLRLNTI